MFNYSIDRQDFYQAFNSASYISILYEVLDKKEERLAWLKKAHEIAKNMGSNSLQREALEQLLYEDDVISNENFIEFSNLVREIEFEKNNTHLKFAEISYDVKKVASENNRLKNQLGWFFTIAMIVVLSLLVFVYFIRLQSRNKELKFIKIEQNANDSINKLIIEQGILANEAKQKERNRIARNLHDFIVNGIFSVRFNLDFLKTDNAEMKDKLVTELQKIEENIRDISHDLSGNYGEKSNGLIELIENYVSLQMNQWGTSFKFKYSDLLDYNKLSEIKKWNIFFIIREAVHNVNKHSKAKHCTIEIKPGKRNNILILTIKDDGIGIDEKIITNGIGFKNLTDRASSIDAKLEIKPSKQKGTVVYLSTKILEI